MRVSEGFRWSVGAPTARTQGGCFMLLSGRCDRFLRARLELLLGGWERETVERDDLISGARRSWEQLLVSGCLFDHGSVLMRLWEVEDDAYVPIPW